MKVDEAAEIVKGYVSIFNVTEKLISCYVIQNTVFTPQCIRDTRISPYKVTIGTLQHTTYNVYYSLDGWNRAVSEDVIQFCKEN
jgi:hypothetical protein